MSSTVEEIIEMERVSADPTPEPLPKPRRHRRPKAVRLHDVAKAAGVSVATVSMVVNSNPRISPATRKRVQRFIEQLGYLPNRAAQILSGARQPSLAVLLPPQRHTFADVYFGELISGIADAAARHGQAIVFERATPEFVRSKKHITMLETKAADGMLILGFNDMHRFLDDFAGTKANVIAVDSKLARDGTMDVVGCDYRSGAQQAMNYLLQLGHRKIGLITATGGGRCTRDVVDVYRAAMSTYGVKPADGWFADGRLTEEGGDEAAAQILGNYPEITALFAVNDKMAIGALHYATRKNLAVPRDLSIVGFDNLRHAAFMNPSLSTVHLPLHEVGARACERLIERINGRSEPTDDRLPTHLVVRNSTGLARDLGPLADSAA
ncbi:MAG: LacI family transcriptional regulator, repressor for deo operon, udp, cdd, tsx, nupC, and nupG [Humisphaera sp.]|nr:LacI family transcriptional regulator, repressor for deo operon, udp, cdd, tsx, nupC, and nupG [Humisphaera sp.]